MIPDCLMLPALRLSARVRDLRADRGDVPGWVLITVMSALLMIALFTISKDRLQLLLDNAFRDVAGQEP